MDKGTGVAIVTRWDEQQYGRSDNTSKDIEKHWFVLIVFDKNEHHEINEYYNFYSQQSESPVSTEIVDYYCLPGEEMVGICKTFWLKMIQRKWKKIYAERKRIKRKRQTLFEIIYRERHGCWRNDIQYMPSLNGMLSK